MSLPYSSVVSTGSQVINFGTNEIGLYFENTTGESVTINELGWWVRPGHNQIHTLSLYTNGSTTALQSVAVNCSGAPSNAFLYGSIPTVTVAPGTRIHVLSSLTSDAYYGFSGGMVLDNEDIGYIGPSSRTGSAAPVAASGHITRCFGPVTFRYTGPLRTWTKDGTVYTTNGSQYQVMSANADSSYGDTIDMPAGTFAVGAGNSSFSIAEGVTLRGAGMDLTTIVFANDGPSGYGTGLIRLRTASTIKDIGIRGPSTGSLRFAFTLYSSDAVDWRLIGVKVVPNALKFTPFYNSNTTTKCRGVISGCDFTGFTGDTEMIYSRGESDAWDNASGVGDENAIYVEDTYFRGSGYVCDANANAKIVIRFCIITGQCKIDGHGLSSNTPFQSCRRVESYYNVFTALAGGWNTHELRGGTYYIFFNTAVGIGAFLARDYGYINRNAQFGNVYQTPANYPIGYQCGTGARITQNVEDVVALQMVRVKTLGDTDWEAMGGTASVDAQFIATGPGTGTGTVTTTPAATEPCYFVGNTVGGNPHPRLDQNASAGAIAHYGSSFKDSALIAKNRDYFATSGFDETFTFDGSKGCGVGTRAQMDAIAANGVAKAVGVGFWVTNEGDWNADLPGESGLFYTWNGSAFALNWTPYDYPHPLLADDTPPEPEPAPTIEVQVLHITTLHLS